MKYLLDSHVIIWLAEIADKKLSPKSMEIIHNKDNQLFVSICFVLGNSLENE